MARRKVRGKPARYASDKRRTRKARSYVVGLDGEGCGRAPHRYTLLAWSDVSGERNDYIENGRGLSTRDCLNFLLSLPTDARAFGFFLGYDWTMALADLPDAKLYRLFRPALRKRPNSEGGGFSYVRWRGFELHWLAGMMRVKRGKRCVTIWDVGRFYQCSFVKALARWDVGTKAEREAIEKMKGKRATFRASDRVKVRGYCLHECRLLADLVERLNAAHDDAGLPLKSWHGPGSTASLMLRAMGIQDKRGEQPRAVQEAAARAFFGGRFEHPTIGKIKGPIHGRDIVSAYPAEAVNLPCLEHACWCYTRSESQALAAEQACVHWELTDGRSLQTWGPLPCRMPDGTIVFPASGARGWAWAKEYAVARKLWPQVKFVEAWMLRRECDCKPFARVAEWFEARNRVGRHSGPGLTYKLGYNSVYGKLAQAVGAPPFRSQIWAGMITSGCRARLLEVLGTRGEDVLAVATDGIYSRGEPPAVDVGESLGQWEPSSYDAITLVRPGIYWTDSEVRARGLGRKALTEAQEQVLEAIEAGADQVELPPITQFGGAVACIYLDGAGKPVRSARFGTWHDRPVRISLDPRPKRAPGWALWKLPGVESVPYGPLRLSPDAVQLKTAAKNAWASQV